jgi:hypothetical protein
MVLTRDFSEVLSNRIQPGLEFAVVQLGEAIGRPVAVCWLTALSKFLL